MEEDVYKRMMKQQEEAEKAVETFFGQLNTVDVLVKKLKDKSGENKNENVEFLVNKNEELKKAMTEMDIDKLVKIQKEISKHVGSNIR